MLPSKPKKDESRRSSILKPRKPRQPLQNVNFNSSSNENSPATLKVKRRVSFAEKKHVKEFCHSTDQGTVWDNTYEEHDFSLKGSFSIDQSIKVDSKEGTSKVPSEDECINIGIETSSSDINDSDLTQSQPCTSVTKVYEDDNDLNFTNPVEHVEMFSDKLPPQQITLSNAPENMPGIVIAYTDKDKENCASNICNKYPEMHASKVNSELDRTCIQDVSMECTMAVPAPLIPIYCDVEDDKQENIQKDNVASHQSNFNTDYTMEMTEIISWKNKAKTLIPTVNQQENIYENKDTNSSFTFIEKTKLLHKSMDITEAVSVPSCQERMYNIEHATEPLISNCNNESMEITQAIPISVEPIKSDIEVSRKVPVIVQNCKDTRCDVQGNSMVLPANLQSTKSIVFNRIHDGSSSHSVPDNSMKLTNETRSLVADINAFNMNDNENNIDFNISMEMTTALRSKIPFEIEKNTMHSCNKSAIKEGNLRKSLEDTERTNKTEFFNNVPMETTRPVNLDERNIPHPNSEDRVIREDLRKNQETNKNSDETELFRDAPMQMTRPINVVLPASVYGKEGLRINESMFRDDRNTFSHNMSMEMTKAISSRHREETFNPIIYEKNECRRNNSMTSSERTKLLCKSMEITETVPDPLLRSEKPCMVENTAELTEAVISRTATTLRTHLRAELPLQSDPAVNNDEAIHTSMEITTAIQSTMHHHMENITLNGMANLDVPQSNESQCLTINNVAEFSKSETRENVTILKETTETINLHNTSSVLTNNFDHKSSAALTNSHRKRSSLESENTSTKRFRSDSPVKSQLSVCGNIHSFSRDDKYVNECLTEDTSDPIRISALSCGSNGNDSPSTINECSFLRKNLENSLVELQSINPPSFVYTSSEEENSFPELLQEDQLHTSITTDAVLINNKNNSSERLELTNIEHDETKDCHCRNVVTDTIENNRGTDCQAIERTIIDDCPVDESNCYATEVEHLDGESVLSTSNVSRGKTMTLSSTDHFTERNATREDQVDEEEYAREEINDEVELRDIEQKEQCSQVGEEEERCIDRLKETEATIKDRVDQDEYCQENSDGEVNPQSMEQEESRVEERLDVEEDVNRIEEEEPLVEQDPFLSLSQKLEAHSERKDCIWNVYYTNVNRRMIGFGFMSNSLLIVTFLSDNLNHSEENLIKEIKIISRLADDADVLIKIVHGLILKKINVETLTHSCRTHEDILPMLDFVSQDVKLAMNFMFDLKRLDDLNLMEIASDKISFVSRSKNMDIILKITINVKRFDKLTPSDVNIHCLLGTIKEIEVKNLIRNVKKDHKFLRRYMNDVRDYIDIIEEISTTLN